MVTADVASVLEHARGLVEAVKVVEARRHPSVHSSALTELTAKAQEAEAVATQIMSVLHEGGGTQPSVASSSARDASPAEPRPPKRVKVDQPQEASLQWIPLTQPAAASQQADRHSPPSQSSQASPSSPSPPPVEAEAPPPAAAPPPSTAPVPPRPIVSAIMTPHPAPAHAPPPSPCMEAAMTKEEEAAAALAFQLPPRAAAHELSIAHAATFGAVAATPPPSGGATPRARAVATGGGTPSEKSDNRHGCQVAIACCDVVEDAQGYRTFVCRFDGCGKSYASRDAVRKHCRIRHKEWFQTLDHEATADRPPLAVPPAHMQPPARPTAKSWPAGTAPPATARPSPRPSPRPQPAPPPADDLPLADAAVAAAAEVLCPPQPACVLANAATHLMSGRWFTLSSAPAASLSPSLAPTAAGPEEAAAVLSQCAHWDVMSHQSPSTSESPRWMPAAPPRHGASLVPRATSAGNNEADETVGAHLAVQV